MKLRKEWMRPPIPLAGAYIWVNTVKGGYWRLNRGSVKKAKLNHALKESSSLMKQSAPAATRILKKLRPFTQSLAKSTVHARISGKLRKTLQLTNKLSLDCLKDFDFQPAEYPFEGLLGTLLAVKLTKHEIVVTIPITELTIQRLNTLMTNYYFELILLYGDAAKNNGLRTESTESTVYVLKSKAKDCRLRLVLPDQPWIALLKINTIEGNEHAASPKYYGLKVIEAGE